MSVLRNLLIEKAKNEPIWLEYLESTGTQYIDTGISPTSNTEAEITWQLTGINHAFDGIFGVRKNAIVSGDGIYWFGPYSNTSFYYRFGNNQDINISLDYNKHTTLIKTSGIYHDNTKVSNGILAEMTEMSSIYIFALHFGKPLISKSKIYSCQIYDSGVLVRDFRPCLNPTTLQPAMYDVVNNQYYYNQGTGEFQYNQ